MNDTKNNLDDIAFIETLLTEQAETTPRPSLALNERILADALNHQPIPNDFEQADPRSATINWSGIADAIGGWMGAGGLVAAAATGIWIGVAQPDSLSGMTALVQQENVEVSLFVDEGLINEDAI